MSFTENQLAVNWGEQYVAAYLARAGCLVRHVPQGCDSGIDLYCETTVQGTPFLHFWCQVKTSSSFRSAAPNASIRLAQKLFAYFRKQPIPVVVILVPHKPDSNPPIFICSPRDIIQGSRTLISALKIKNLSGLQAFLRDQLVEETFVWELSHGKVSPFKTPSPSYTVAFPVGTTHTYDKQLRQSLRFTLTRLSEDILRRHFKLANLTARPSPEITRDKAIEQARPYIEALGKIALGTNMQNFDVYVSLGLLAELDGHYGQAKEYYQRSLATIDNDQRIQPLNEGWQRTRQEVANHLSRVERRISKK
jgi:hypothetical protein